VVTSQENLLAILGGILGLLLVLLLCVVFALLRALRRTRRTSTSDLPKLPAVEGASEEDEEEKGDFTLMTPFSLVPVADLPKLSSDEEYEAASEEPGGDSSKALLHFEGGSWAGVDEPTGPTDVIRTSAAGQTDRGVTRRRNEDAYLVDGTLNLYVIADGMGGYAGGQIASRLAVEQVHGHIHAGTKAESHLDRPRRGREVIAAMERANASVFLASTKDKSLRGMGTTLLVARFSLQKRRMYLGHVGDSRCYRLRGGQLKLLTTDHTLGARGVVGPLADNIRRAIGVAPRVKVDLIVDEPRADDVYLLCSDGLNKMVSDDQLSRILSGDDDPDRSVSSLIAAANANGGRDNITAIVIRVSDVTLSWGRKLGSGSFAAHP
jgi:PPM family protein phosphatase